MIRRGECALTDAELAAWKASRRRDGTRVWPEPGWPTWDQWQEYIREAGWRANAVAAENLAFTERKKGHAA
jgi:hypothetical protein